MPVNSLRRLVRHDDRTRRGEHAADTMADRDLDAGDLCWGNAAHLAHALLQGVHAGMHVGKTGVGETGAIGGRVAVCCRGRYCARQ